MSVDTYQTVTGKEIRIHVGQSGQRISLAIGRSAVDLTGHTRLEIGTKSPNGTVAYLTASEISPAENRSMKDKYGNTTTELCQVEYTTVGTEFTLAGEWTMWAEYDIAGDTHIGAAFPFTVVAVGAT